MKAKGSETRKCFREIVQGEGEKEKANTNHIGHRGRVREHRRKCEREKGS